MIQLMGRPFQLDDSTNMSNTEKMIIQSMDQAPDLYSYHSMDEFSFEINIRRNIIESAISMSEGQSQFTTFENTSCNPSYWYVSESGGFLLRNDVRPSDGIWDIYRNSSLYSFECATACVINFYHAILRQIGDHLFNLIFQNLYLYSWHTDSDLELQTFYGDLLPGDVVYFSNPDVNPNTFWYRGENAVFLGNDLFFGHGIGIKSAEEMIQILNEFRQPQSTQSSYLTNLITRPSFSRLYQFLSLQRNDRTYKKQQYLIHHNHCSISYLQHLYFLFKR